MKMGAEKKGEVIVLVVLLGIAALLLGRSLLTGSGGPSTSVPAAAVAATAPAAAAPASLAQMDPRLHLAKLEALRARAYAGDGRNLFRFGSAPPPPPSAAQVAASRRALASERAAAERMQPQGPPPPPPIPLQFYGFATSAGQPERIFVQFGEDSYVVSQGDTIAHRYQIEAIGKASVRVKDLMTQSVQEIPLQRPADG